MWARMGADEILFEFLLVKHLWLWYTIRNEIYP